MSAELVLLLAAIGFGVGFVKSAFGIGAGILFAPILAMFMEPKLAIGLTAPLMLVADVTTVQVYWRRWDVGTLRLLLPAALAGIVVGASFLASAPAAYVRRGIGVVALVFAVTQAWRLVRPRVGREGWERSPRSSWPLASAAGVVGGIVSAIAHSGGLVFSFYLLPRTRRVAFVGSLAVMLLVVDTAKLLAFWRFRVIGGPELLAGLALAPVMLVGSRLGGRVNGRLSERAFLAAVTVLVLLAGIALISR